MATYENMNDGGTKQLATAIFNKTKTALDNAASSASGAATSANNASDSATLSRSWAVGDTESREGETTNNAQYYAGQALASATSAGASATSAGESATAAADSASSAATSAATAERAASAVQTVADDADRAEAAANNAEASASAADTSKTNAASSATSASGSATAASGSATAAAGSATSAADSASDAEAWAVGERDGAAVEEGDDTYRNNSKYYAEQASASAQTATTAVTGIDEKVSSASTSAENAAASALAAAGSATAASGSAENASASATAASTSAGNAATSETNAANSASAAASSASDAQTKAGEAATSATNAAASESTASTAATTAITKAGEAATSATNAAASESAASTSATNAAASASAASTSETNAASSATSAATSATEAAEIVHDTVKWSERKGYVGKNLSPFTLIKPYTDSGITITPNSDGSLSIDGTYNNNASLWIYFNIVDILMDKHPSHTPKGDVLLDDGIAYVFSVEEADGGNFFSTLKDKNDMITIMFGITSDTGAILNDMYPGVRVDSGRIHYRTITPPFTENGIPVSYLAYRCGIRRNSFPTDVEIHSRLYPMLRLASIEDDTYEPYIPPNDELSGKIDIFVKKLQDNARSHNSLYVEENLGTSITTEQSNAIANGTFKDIYPGCYWTINGRRILVGGLNCYMGVGDNSNPNSVSGQESVVASNHIVVTYDNNVGSCKMNDTNTTEGGYTGSKGYTEYFEPFRQTARGDLGDHIIKHRTLLPTTATGGKTTSWKWTDRDVDIMSAVNVFGYPYVFSNANGHDLRFDVGCDYMQLPIFRHAPELAHILQSNKSTRIRYWLHSVFNATAFALVGDDGYPAYYDASLTSGFRPIVLVK